MGYRNEYIEERWRQLHGLEKEWGDRALKYLLVTNSGGAIAVLSFIGAEKSSDPDMGVKITLFLFVLGIVLVGISMAMTFHHISGLFLSWKSDAKRYHANQISWTNLTGRDNERSKVRYIDYAVPYAAFTCFVMGCMFGAFSFF